MENLKKAAELLINSMKKFDSDALKQPKIWNSLLEKLSSPDTVTVEQLQHLRAEASHLKESGVAGHQELSQALLSFYQLHSAQGEEVQKYRSGPKKTLEDKLDDHIFGRKF